MDFLTSKKFRLRTKKLNVLNYLFMKILELYFFHLYIPIKHNNTLAFILGQINLSKQKRPLCINLFTVNNAEIKNRIDFFNRMVYICRYLCLFCRYRV